ncbi:MAG: FIST N-terminal domain-containing protein [Candidatus Hadarchaeales archaeon]
MIVVVALCAIVAALAVSVSAPPLSTIQTIPPPERLQGSRGVFSCAGYGWSTNGDPFEAVSEAAEKVREVMGENEPGFLFLFCSSRYDEDAVLQETRRQFPGAKVYGGTSSLGVMTSAGFHLSDNGSLVIMGIHSSRITLGVGHASFDELPPENAGEVAVRRAMEDAGREGEMPAIILVTMAPGNEEAVLSGIAGVVGENVPVFGGSSADDDLSGKWKQFANDTVLSNGVALAAVFTDLCTCYHYATVYEVTEREGTITSAQGRTIYEIDGLPAAEVYNSWTGGLISEKLENGGSIIVEASYWPLAKVVRGPIGRTFRVSMHPVYVENGAITVYAEVENGMKVSLLHGSWELLLNQSGRTAKKASEMCTGRGIFAIFTHCAGTMMAIPEDERPKIPLLVAQGIGETPFIGAFTFGEQGFVEDVGNVHGNLTDWILFFSEEVP